MIVLVHCSCVLSDDQIAPLFVAYECDKVDKDASAMWSLESADGFTLSREQGEHTQRVRLPHRIIVRYAQGNFFIQSKKILARLIRLEPNNGVFLWRGTTYEGNLRFSCDESSCSFICYHKTKEVPKEKKQEELSQQHEMQQVQKDLLPLDDAAFEKPKERVFGVKVLLAEEPATGSWRVELPGKRCYVLDPNNRKRYSVLEGASVEVKRMQKQWFVNGKRVLAGNQCWVRPEKGLCVYNGVTYHGSILFVLDKGSMLVINCLDLENYVSCVLYAETWPGWPIEMNKTQAVVCRTYVLSMVAEARRLHKLYHIKNTNIHQMYEGAHSVKVLQDAVEQTKGLFLSYKNKPITAMFDGCCGGVIPADIHGYDFVTAPYLARKKACTYCKTSKVYRWDIAYSTHELVRRLSAEFPSLSTIVDIAVTKRDAAGLVKAIVIKDKKRSYTLTGKKIYALVRGVKSFCFTITKRGNTVYIKGRGYGHHMGLCQWGAREMVRAGFTFRQILSFYYPGIMLMRLQG